MANFTTFQSQCKNRGDAFVYRDDHTRMKSVCYRRDRIPEGHSWGICDEKHCPFFGVKITGTNCILYGDNDDELCRCKEISFIGTLSPEDYE